MLFTAILKDNSGFMRCYKKGKRVSCDWLCVHFFPNNMPCSRLGITAGKKLGNAVTRNRVKRIIRAAYRLCEQDLPIGYDIVFVGRNGVQDKTSCDVQGFISERLIKEINKPFEKKQGFVPKKKKPQ